MSLGSYFVKAKCLHSISIKNELRRVNMTRVNSLQYIVMTFSAPHVPIITLKALRKVSISRLRVPSSELGGRAGDILPPGRRKCR